MTSLRITEIFHSLQGESASIGIPTVFIRLTGCPLRCTYCDTAYAFTGGHKMALADILTDVARYGCRYVTVTGGEPLAQVACLALLSQLADKGYIVSLETSGALNVAAVDPRIIKVMDLKTPSSGEVERNLYSNIDYLTAQDQVKFVIGTPEDYDWSKKMIADYDLANRCHLLFSPVMQVSDDQRVALQSPTELAEKILHDKLPVRFQIQLHKLLWQNAQGK